MRAVRNVSRTRATLEPYNVTQRMNLGKLCTFAISFCATLQLNLASECKRTIQSLCSTAQSPYQEKTENELAKRVLTRCGCHKCEHRLRVLSGFGYNALSSHIYSKPNIHFDSCIKGIQQFAYQRIRKE